jgi:hypothetical protein
MGRVTVQAENTHTLATNTVAGTFIVTAANGDTITGTSSGVVIPTADPLVVDFRLDSTITGGTGRFAEASGTITGAGTSFILSVDPTGVIQSRNEQVLHGSLSY